MIHHLGRFRSWRSRPKPRFAADLLAGAFIGCIGPIFALSYAALIFAGTPPAVQGAGLVVVLTGSVLIGTVTALLSSLPFAVAAADGNSVAVLASMAAAIGTAMGPAASPAALAATLFTGISFASLAVGVLLFCLGVARIGRMVRFVPFPVIAGFLAATGWALCRGGAALGTGGPLVPSLLADPGGLVRLGLSLALAGVFVPLLVRLPHPATLPMLLLVTLAGFHLVAAALGFNMPALRARGWLLEIPRQLSLASPWRADALALIDWPALAARLPGLVAVAMVTLVTVLMNVSGLETSTGRDLDFDRELRAGGLAALLSGLFGGIPGNIMVSRSLLLRQAGGVGRTAGVAASLICGLLPLLVPGLVTMVPRPVMAALLLATGMQLLLRWVVGSRKLLSRSEWWTVLAVLAVAVRFGVVAAVFAGLLLGCASFVVIYSRLPPLRACCRGDVARSNVARPEAERAALLARADALLVLYLQGFIFFGTASRLLQEIRREINATPGRLRFLVLDFAAVDGLDGSAIAGFTRLQGLAQAEHIALVLTGMAPAIAARLTLSVGDARLSESLDAGLEWCEAALLAELPPGAAPDLAAQLSRELGPDQAAALGAMLEAEELPQGAVLLRQGESSRDLLFLERGHASVSARFEGGRPIRVRRYGPGTMLGEIGFCLEAPRSATVRADEPCRVLRLTREALHRLERDHPAAALAFHRAMQRGLAERLLDRDELLASLMRGSARPD